MKPFPFKTLAIVGIFLFGAAILLISAPAAIDRWVADASSEPARTYRISKEIPYLTDNIALHFATKLMNDEGNVDGWLPLEDRRTKSPDGTPDVYVARNSINPNRGYICFRRAGDGQLQVQMEYDSDTHTIECQLWYPK